MWLNASCEESYWSMSSFCNESKIMSMDTFYQSCYVISNKVSHILISLIHVSWKIKTALSFASLMCRLKHVIPCRVYLPSAQRICRKGRFTSVGISIHWGLFFNQTYSLHFYNWLVRFTFSEKVGKIWRLSCCTVSKIVKGECMALYQSCIMIIHIWKQNGRRRRIRRRRCNRRCKKDKKVCEE